MKINWTAIRDLICLTILAAGLTYAILGVIWAASNY